MLSPASPDTSNHPNATPGRGEIANQTIRFFEGQGLDRRVRSKSSLLSISCPLVHREAHNVPITRNIIARRQRRRDPFRPRTTQYPRSMTWTDQPLTGNQHPAHLHTWVASHMNSWLSRITDEHSLVEIFQPSPSKFFISEGDKQRHS